MQIDFSTLVKNQDGDLPQRVKTDNNGEVVKEDGKPVMEEQEVEVGDHVIDFLNRAIQESDNLKEINALRSIMGDISRGKTEYSEDDIELVKEKIEDQLPLDDDSKKPPMVMTSMAKLLDDNDEQNT